MRKRIALLLVIVSGCALAQTKPRVTLDEFFNSVAFSDLKLSPDGKGLLIGTTRPDWKHNRFRKDIWLWRDGMSAPVLLTQSGHDSSPRWSPDGNWIAFLSDRAGAELADEIEESKVAPAEPPKPRGRDEGDDEKPKNLAQVYLLPVMGGEAFPATRGLEEVHAFDWSPDSKALYFATRAPWSKQKREAYKNDWKDVVRYREQERGDVIVAILVAQAVASQAEPTVADAAKSSGAGEQHETAETRGARVLAETPWKVGELAVSPDGRKIAFNTSSVFERIEGVGAYELYLVDSAGGVPRQLTRNQGREDHPHWAPDSRTLLFSVGMGSVEDKYEDVQARAYAVDSDSGALRRRAGKFPGAITAWDVTRDGMLVSAGRVGTEVQVYSEMNTTADLAKVTGWSGTYERIAVAEHSPRVAFIYGAVNKPTEVYVAESLAALTSAKPVTSFNRLFAERDLPEGKPYTWKADDGASVEGMLFYPPGKLGAKKLRTFVFIHGGPGDADGNDFGANWYNWAILAASNDWLVFRPNYRGSNGYGDKFMRDIAPNLVSRPGKDILKGVDALVADGIADPDRLVIGGYSYGGYMTNWLITQTTRFKAAVTGAGAVEHAANWGNDDLTFDDAWFLGGAPWEAQKTYNAEAALWQLNKVKTPTHMVGGADDIRVAVAENYLLERALHALGVPSSLLIFPGEGHGLAKNPWHGKIKVREELKWLEKYGGGPPAATHN